MPFRSESTEFFLTGSDQIRSFWSEPVGIRPEILALSLPFRFKKIPSGFRSDPTNSERIRSHPVGYGKDLHGEGRNEKKAHTLTLPALQTFIARILLFLHQDSYKFLTGPHTSSCELAQGQKVEKLKVKIARLHFLKRSHRSHMMLIWLVGASSLLGAFGGGFGWGKKLDRSRIIIVIICCPFRLYWGAGWGGLQQEHLDDEFYK